MMSHALQLAKIDHIVLEKHAEVYSYSGGAIGIWPHTARVIDQCGFLKKFEEGCEPIYREYRTGPGGKHIAEVGAWKPIAQVYV
jgi:FAD dependent monooxygenase